MFAVEQTNPPLAHASPMHLPTSNSSASSSHMRPTRPTSICLCLPSTSHNRPSPIQAHPIHPRLNPPTHCQLLLYYVLFQSCMGRHRDNYTVRHLRALLQEGTAAGSTHGNMENSQRLGSEVLLYTEGTTPMDFTLSFPPGTSLDTGIQNYACRSVFTVQLRRGTLVIFKDCDDQFFCHEASFHSKKTTPGTT